MPPINDHHHCLSSSRGGLEEKKAAKTYSLSNRATKILQLRKELKSLKQQYKEASEEERDALSELCRILRKKLTTLTRAKWHRRRK